MNVSQIVAGNVKTLKKTIFFFTTHNDLPLNVCAGRGERGLSVPHHIDFSSNAPASQASIYGRWSVQSSALRLGFWNEIFKHPFVYWRRNDGPKEAQ